MAKKPELPPATEDFGSIVRPTSPPPPTRFVIAKRHRARGELLEAIEKLREYLGDDPKDMKFVWWSRAHGGLNIIELRIRDKEEK